MITIEIALVIVCLIPFPLIFIIGRLGNKINDLELLNSDLEDQLEKSKLLQIPPPDPVFVPGRKVLIPNYGLERSKGEYKFKVTYECEITESTSKKIKVSAFNFRSDDSWAKDPCNNQALIDFMQGRWIELDSDNPPELIFDESVLRDVKINKILS